jgi:type II secretory pathway pseudopilin PulG
MRRAPATKVFLGIVIAAVVLAVVSGLMLLGSPGEAHIRRLDERRVGDLRDIGRAIDLYRSKHDRLPDSIGDLSSDPEVRLRVQDPVTSEPYEYHVLGSNAYELCARFDRDNLDSMGRNERFDDASWNHGTGRQCFQRKTKGA